jgi:hypothetical protein
MRQRRHRARKGQVAAVATILGLLLVVSFVANYLSNVLPAQMEVNELSHITTVEDQLGRLQAVLYAGSLDDRTDLPLTQPVTLGSSGQPPFGAADSGILSPGSTGSNLSFHYTVGATVYTAPSWSHGSLCTTSTAVSCTNSQSNTCSPPLEWNESANGTAYTFSLSGSNNCVQVDWLGSNDVITLAVSGSNLGYFTLQLFGANDTVVLGNGFSGSGFHASIYLYGQNDTYEAASGPTGSHLFLNTYFIGETAAGTGCGVANLSATDHWSITGSSAGSSVQNLTWYNMVGHSTAYHTTSGWPGVGNSGSGDKIGWQNISTSEPCAFWSLQGFTQSSRVSAGIVAHLNNAYVSPVDVAYQDGAEIYAQEGGTPVMVGGPHFELTHEPGGTPHVEVWIPQFVGNFTGEAGTETAALVFQLLAFDTVTLPTVPAESALIAPVTLTLNTTFAPAWISYFDSLPALFPNGATCTGASCTGTYSPTAAPSEVVATMVDDPSITIQVALYSVVVE